MHGHDPHAVVALGAGRRLGVDVRVGARREEVEQPAQVATLGRFEVGREAHQLAHVGEARFPGRPQQHREVVPELGHGGVDQLGQGKGDAALAQPREGLGEGAQQRPLLRGDRFEPLRVGEIIAAPARHSLDRRPDVTAGSGRRPQQPERVRGDAAGGRREGAEDGLVVERVGDRRQQRADVGDLLL